MPKILLKNIEYLERMKDDVKIHIEGASPVLTVMSLKRILEKLPAADFKRIHRSIIVPVRKVQSLQNRKIKFSSIELPVSGSYVDEVKLAKKLVRKQVYSE